MQNATTNVTISTIITHFHFVLFSRLFIDCSFLKEQTRREKCSCFQYFNLPLVKGGRGRLKQKKIP